MKLIRTLLLGDGENVCSGLAEGGTDCSGEIDGDSSSVGEGVGAGDSCGAAVTTNATQQSKVRMLKRCSAIRDLSIVAPIQVRKNVIPPFAVAEKFFIDIICDKLIVQTVEASKVIDRALSGIFARSPGFD